MTHLPFTRFFIFLCPIVFLWSGIATFSLSLQTYLNTFFTPSILEAHSSTIIWHESFLLSVALYVAIHLLSMSSCTVRSLTVKFRPFSKLFFSEPIDRWKCSNVTCPIYSLLETPLGGSLGRTVWCSDQEDSALIPTRIVRLSAFLLLLSSCPRFDPRLG